MEIGSRTYLLSEEFENESKSVYICFRFYHLYIYNAGMYVLVYVNIVHLLITMFELNTGKAWNRTNESRLKRPVA